MSFSLSSQTSRSDFSALARRLFFGDCKTGINIGDAGRLRGDPGAEDVPIGEIERVLPIDKGRVRREFERMRNGLRQGCRAFKTPKT